MGTNFYRIPPEHEMVERKENLLKNITNLNLSSHNILHRFEFPIVNSWVWESNWDIFLKDTKIHLGKRSGGWKFLWNFHDGMYYTNKEELFSFIRSGRVISEYDELIDNDEFIEMSLNWGQPDGHVYNQEYIDGIRRVDKYYNLTSDPNNFDKTIDGLNVSNSIDFS